MIYKVSYVVIGGKHPGAIKSLSEKPQPGDRVRLGKKQFEVIEVKEILPPRDEYGFLHVTLREA